MAATLPKLLAGFDIVAAGEFGGELSGHFYYRDNFFADSGMITLVHLLNILTAGDQPLSELVQPLQRFASSGETSFEIEDKEAMIEELTEKYSDAEIDHLDGVTIQYPQWWFNCRPSNTEPLLRLNVEAVNQEMLQEKVDELKTLLGEPVEH